MQITEVRIKIIGGGNPLAFACIEFDKSFVLHDLKVIRGKSGIFVAMPSRRKTDRCPQCGTKNHLRAAYCNSCGTQLDPDRIGHDPESTNHLYSDIGHPIHSSCRQAISSAVIDEYHREQARSADPGYVSRYNPAWID